MDRLRTASLGAEEERASWDSLAAACSPPLRRAGSFALIGFTFFITLMTAVILFYNLFGERHVEGQGVMVPQAAFYLTMLASFLLCAGGYAVWMSCSALSHHSAAKKLREAGLDPLRPTLGGLRAYSDEQLLALRDRYEWTKNRKHRRLMERTFGFEPSDAFELAPLSVLPETFEMNALRVEWESNLLLGEASEMPRITWWKESRLGLLPRRVDRTFKLLWSRRYTEDSVRLLKRRYGFRTDRWHETIPEGKLWDAVRDHEDARRIQNAIDRRRRFS